MSEAEAGPAGAREDACRDYQSSLEDLTFNSKPYINMLTILAEENLPFAKEIVSLIEAQTAKAPSSEKLPVLYLMDSIVKNVGREYLTAFTKNLVATFICVFEKVDENTRKSLFKLRSTWDKIFPLKKLYALDVRVNSLDPAWPIQPLPRNVNTSSIHVNPKFLNKSPEEPSAGKIRQSGCKQSHMEDFMTPSREERNAKRSTEQDVRDPKRIKKTEEERPQETTSQHSTKSGTEPKENVENWSNSKSNKRWKSGWEENKSLQQGDDHRESWSSTKGILSPRAPKQQHRLSVDANLQIPKELTLASKRELLQKTSERLASGEITQDEFLVVHQIRQLFQYQEGVREEQRSPFNDHFPLKRPRCEDADKPFVDNPASRFVGLDTNQRLIVLAEDRPLFDGPSRPSVTRDGPTKMIFEGPSKLSPRIDGPPAPGSLRFDGSPGQMGGGGPLRFEGPQGQLGGACPLRFEGPPGPVGTPLRFEGPIGLNEVAAQPPTEEEEDQNEDQDVPDLTNFTIEELKQRYDSVINRLYTGIQCYSCGMRFTTSQADVYADHLDGHYRQNRTEKDASRKVTHRRWYNSSTDWIECEGTADLEERAKSQFFEKVHEEVVLKTQEAAKEKEFQSVPAGPAGAVESCEICQEQFEQYWDEEEEEWHLKNAIRVDGKIYHPSCYEDYQNTSSFDCTPSPSKTPVENPLNIMLNIVKNELQEPCESPKVKEEQIDTPPACTEESIATPIEWRRASRSCSRDMGFTRRRVAWAPSGRPSASARPVCGSQHQFPSSPRQRWKLPSHVA
ncbi:PREDICTED: LOW QUALITY PROTEIN: pre-mRNA cleavage complex 2 protein Pcf11-like [Myotis brandtii]|uniref:LOW QUALITY PROTEIN: pre-mRNA cleavage complex 2 protein Pcf11-like n=1 Tax=Myotis brandtii TaxID=109478 RepID=UPI000704081F|nr:PREDICTED: LOW QUALITY PROTEIN: pre-mRNA cleavage complex 2 protein Pcf11-like [Myotis brandtii]